MSEVRISRASVLSLSLSLPLVYQLSSAILGPSVDNARFYKFRYDINAERERVESFKASIG